MSLGLLCYSRTQDWGATKFNFKRNKGTRKRRRNRKKINVCVFQDKSVGSTFSREESRAGQCHSLFNLRSRRRYSLRLPYFLGLRPRLLIRKPEWMSSSTGLG